jgi:hypothetical protein
MMGDPSVSHWAATQVSAQLPPSGVGEWSRAWPVSPDGS